MQCLSLLGLHHRHHRRQGSSPGLTGTGINESANAVLRMEFQENTAAGASVGGFYFLAIHAKQSVKVPADLSV